MRLTEEQKIKLVNLLTITEILNPEDLIVYSDDIDSDIDVAALIDELASELLPML